MKRFARTRSEKRDSHPLPGRAQWSVGSIDDDGIRYGLTTQALIASTAPTATTIVTAQSTTVRQRGGSVAVIRSTGPLTECPPTAPGSDRPATLRCVRGPPRGGLPELT